MPMNYNEAVDELFGIISDAWTANSSAIVGGYIPEIRWPGKPEPTKPPMDKFWARVVTRIVTDSQRSFATFEGSKRYEAHGLLYLQIFAPRTVAGSLEQGRLLAQMIRSCFRKQSPSGSIFFRDQQVKELNATEENYPVNVSVEFVYDTIE